MNYTSSVYDLVLSLTKTEKRYFKLFARLNKEKSNLIRLFDAISINGLHHDKEVKAYFSAQPFIKHFDVYKVHLKDSILQSMRNFHQNRNLHNVLQNNLEDAWFLYEKGLFKQCGKLIERSKQLARESENNTVLLALLDLEYKIPVAKDIYPHNNKKLNQLFKDQNAILTKLHDEFLISYQITSAGLLLKKFEFTCSETDYFELVKVLAELNNSERILSSALQRKFYTVKVEFFMVIHQYTEAKLHVDLLINVFENSNLIIRENIGRYIKALQDRITCCIQLKQFEEALKRNDDLKQAPNRFDKIQKRNTKILSLIDGYYLQNKLRTYLHCGEMEKSEICVAEIDVFISQKRKQISDVLLIELIILIAYYFFMKQEHRKAEAILGLHKINISGIKSSEQTIDLFLLKYLIAYSSGKMKERGPLLRSLYRILLIRKGLTQFEQTCFDFIKRSATKKEPSRSKRTWENLLLQELYKQEASPTWYARSIRFDLISWLESRQEKKPFYHILALKYLLAGK